jgi:hypothetical protein
MAPPAQPEANTSANVANSRAGTVRNVSRMH